MLLLCKLLCSFPGLKRRRLLMRRLLLRRHLRLRRPLSARQLPPLRKRRRRPRKPLPPRWRPQLRRQPRQQKAAPAAGAKPAPETYSAARQDTVKTGKPMVVMVSTDWCPPCQVMKRTILPRVRAHGLLRQGRFRPGQSRSGRRVGEPAHRRRADSPVGHVPQDLEGLDPQDAHRRPERRNRRGVHQGRARTG